MKRIGFDLEPELLKQLAKMEAASGFSRSKLLRMAIWYLSKLSYDDFQQVATSFHFQTLKPKSND